MQENQIPVGQTKNSGFEIGVRKTFSLPLEKVWEILFSEPVKKIWLGDIPPAELENLTSTLKPLSHIRMQWKRKEWNHFSILQIRIIQAKTGVTVSFHQEKLLNSKERDEMKLFWENVMEKIGGYLK